MKIHGLKGLVGIFLILANFHAYALDFQIPIAIDISSFGTIFSNRASSRSKNKEINTYGGVPRASILLTLSEEQISMPSSGSIIYMQSEAPPQHAQFTFPLGNAIATLHTENFVSVIAGLDSAYLPMVRAASRNSESQNTLIMKGMKLPAREGSGIFEPQTVLLALYDSKSALWVNPLMLSSWIHDRINPVIQSVRLSKKGANKDAYIELLPMRDGRELTLSLLQGTYEIFIDAYDRILPEGSTFSAPFRFTVLVDGENRADNSFLGGKSTEKGLSFLGNPPPSSSTVTRDGFYKIAEISFLRGVHNLQIVVSDYAGNQSVIRSKCNVR